VLSAHPHLISKHWRHGRVKVDDFVRHTLPSRNDARGRLLANRLNRIYGEYWSDLAPLI